MTRFQTYRLGGSQSAHGAPSGGFGEALVWILGMLIGGAALVVGAIFAVFTAVAVAVLALFAGIAVWAVRLTRGRQRATPAQTAADDGVIDARKVGDQWVAYGFDNQAR